MNTPTVFILDGDPGSPRDSDARKAEAALPRFSGKPFLSLQLEWLARQAFANVIFVSNRVFPDLPGCRNDSLPPGISMACLSFDEMAEYGTGGKKCSEGLLGAECLFIESSILFDIPLDWLVDYRRTALPAGSVCAALRYAGTSEDPSRFLVGPDWAVARVDDGGVHRDEGYVYGGILAAGAGSLRDLGGSCLFSRSALLADLIRKNRLFGVPFGGKFIDTRQENALRPDVSSMGGWHFRKKAPALFLDRDGILVEDTGYVKDPDSLVFRESFFELSRMAQDRGFLIVVLSNQAGVAKGVMTVGDVERVNARILEEFSRYGVKPAAIYWCPYHEEGVVPEWTRFSLMRKPEPAMALKAMEEHPIDPLKSIMVGDKNTDRIRLPYLRTFLVPQRYPVDDFGNVVDISHIEGIIRSY